MLGLVTTLGAFLAFAAFWCLVLFTISQITGWAQLAKRFPAETVPEGNRFNWQSLRIGRLTDYSNCVVIVVNRRGLYLAVQLPFRCGHPPIFIPWSEISTGQCKRQLFGGPRAELVIGTPTIATLRISLKVIQAAGRLLEHAD